MTSSLLVPCSTLQDASLYASVQEVTQTDRRMDAKITIVLVEDDPLMLLLLETILLKQNYQVWKAETGYAALTRVAEEQHPPDMVLCDYQLPDRNGLVVIDQIRACVEISQLPALLMSANLPSHTELLAQHIAGVEKPFAMTTLLHLVQEMLRKPKVLSVFSNSVQDNHIRFI